MGGFSFYDDTMIKGSLVIFQDLQVNKKFLTGVVLKGPYGTVLFNESTKQTQEVRVVDVLFGTQVVEKVPVKRLKTVR